MNAPANRLKIKVLRVEVRMSDGTERVIEMGKNDPFFRCALDLGRDAREIEPEDFTSWRVVVPGDRFNLTLSASGTNAVFSKPSPRAIEGS